MVLNFMLILKLVIESERKSIGFLAQEIKLIIPEVVRANYDDGLKSTKYLN